MSTFMADCDTGDRLLTMAQANDEYIKRASSAAAYQWLRRQGVPMEKIGTQQFVSEKRVKHAMQQHPKRGA